jgi:hypothetical protein
MVQNKSKRYEKILRNPTTVKMLALQIKKFVKLGELPDVDPHVGGVRGRGLVTPSYSIFLVMFDTVFYAQCTYIKHILYVCSLLTTICSELLFV